MSADEKANSNKSKRIKPADGNVLAAFRCGPITAHVRRDQSPVGLPYLYFTLDRQWKTQTGKTGHSNKYFAHNVTAVTDASTKASAWIAENHSRYLTTSEDQESAG
jgi:hypothetical protein